MAHISHKPDSQSFLKNLAYARTLNLLNMDFEHYTSEVLYQLAENIDLKAGYDLQTLVLQSMKVAEDVSPSFTDYKEFLLAAREVLLEFGIDAKELPDYCAHLGQEPARPGKVKALADALKNAIAAIRSTPSRN